MSVRKLIAIWALYVAMAATAMVLNGEGPSPKLELEVYSATWCGPCKVFKPIVQRVAKEESVRAHFNVTSGAFPPAWERIGIKSVPTVRFMKGGREVHRCGPVNPHTLKYLIRKYK